MGSCYHGHWNVFLLRMRRRPHTLLFINFKWVDQGVGLSYSIIRYIQLSGQPLEPRCPDNRGSTVVWLITNLSLGLRPRHWLVISHMKYIHNLYVPHFLVKYSNPKWLHTCTCTMYYMPTQIITQTVRYRTRVYPTSTLSGRASSSWEPLSSPKTRQSQYHMHCMPILYSLYTKSNWA